MKKKVSAIVLVLTLLLALNSMPALAAQTTVETADQLTNALVKGCTNIQLLSDITYTDGYLNILYEVEIDLNSHKINFAPDSGTAKLVIGGNGSLVLNDTSSGKNGCIDGSGTNGLVQIQSGGKLILNNGSIDKGVVNNGTLTMSGGCIRNPGNSSNIIIQNNGTMYANGGTIRFNVKGEKIVNSGTIQTYTTVTTPTTFLCDIQNDGTLSGGSYSGTVTNASATSIISGGTYSGLVYADYGKITGGTFNGTVQTREPGKQCTVTGGIFYGTIASMEANADVKDSAYVSITYNTVGGSTVEAKKIIRGQKLPSGTTAPAPTKVGYLFSGWYKDSAYTESFDFSIAFIENCTAYAKWTECYHTNSTTQPTCTDSATCSECAKTLEKLGHMLVETEDGTSWKCTRTGCNYTISKDQLPSLTLNGADKVCRTQDYTAAFTLQEGLTSPEASFDFGLHGDWVEATAQQDNTYTVIITKSLYLDTDSSFTVYATAKTEGNDTLKVSKKVTILDEHEGGTATCITTKVCTVCDTPYGNVDPDHHENLIYFPGKDATETEEGNIPYWYCDDCKKYFRDEDAKQPITYQETIIAKKTPQTTPADTTTPADDATAPDSVTPSKTGDSSSIFLWVALLLVSAGAVTAILVCSRKRTRV